MLHHLDYSPLIYNRFGDATSSRQLFMTVKLLMYVMINIYSEFNSQYNLSIDRFSLSL